MINHYTVNKVIGQPGIWVTRGTEIACINSTELSCDVCRFNLFLRLKAGYIEDETVLANYCSRQSTSVFWLKAKKQMRDDDNIVLTL